MARLQHVVFVCCLMVAVMTAMTSASRGGHRNARSGVPALVRAAGRDEERPSIKYENFDEYLLSIGAEESRQRAQNQVNKDLSPPRRHPVPSQATDDEDLIGGSGDSDDERTETATSRTATMVPQPEEGRRPEAPSPAWDLDILGYFRDVPREHWSCCMLGKLAGDKGFHCYAGFYAARIQTRNLNRAHNKKMHFHGHDAIPHWGTNIMHTFERCVATVGDEFHKCCYAATIEKRERQKWSQYANQGQHQEEQREVQAQREAVPSRQATYRQQSQRSSSANRPHQQHHRST